MDEIKTLGFDWQYGHEEMALQVASYANNGCLYIGLYNKTEDGFESFGDLTVNLPVSSMFPPEPNEAYINDFASRDKLAFIKKHQLGVILPEVGFSGYCSYAKVAFDLERLREFDPKGVEEHLRQGQEQPGKEETDQPKEVKKPRKRKQSREER